MDDDSDPTGDAAGITKTRPARRAGPTSAPPPNEPAAAEASPPADAETTTEGPTLVRARWVGPPVWNPEQGVIGYGDAIEVTPEQLEQDATPAIAWDDDWAPDPERAAEAALALGEGDETPEEG